MVRLNRGNTTVKHKKWKAAGCVVVLLAGLVVALLLLPGCVDRVIFQPPPQRASIPGCFRLELPEEAGHIGARYLPAPEGGITLLYSHGNAEDLASIAYRLSAYHAQGYGILAYDYEGYGESSGTPSETAAYRDIERCWQFLTVEKQIPPESIVIYGRSVGTGPAVWLATRRRALALVLEAPFTSTFAVAGLDWLPGDRFPNLDRIGRVDQPLLVIHGDRDQVIPQHHGRKLADAAAAPKSFYNVGGAGHNNILLVAGREYWNNLREFLTRAKHEKE